MAAVMPRWTVRQNGYVIGVYGYEYVTSDTEIASPPLGVLRRYLDNDRENSATADLLGVTVTVWSRIL